MKLQGPRGTRDFYPEQMAWHNHLLDTWQRVSIRNGFEHIEGPIFESLDLYKIKSGEGIISELFHFEDRGGRQLAMRPEFTPTLARMVAEKANSLPKPIKWFCTPNCCRAERPQRGRLREFWQWNIDMLGLDNPVADAEVIFTAIDLFRELGLTSDHLRIKISHRDTVRHILGKLGVADARMLEAFDLLDRRDKLDPAEFTRQAGELGLDEAAAGRFDEVCRLKYRAGSIDRMREALAISDELADLRQLDEQLRAFGIDNWCEYDLGIVRGLAYYTGTVFEAHETSGALRAVMGGGRYDNLIELFGGPATPAVGFGMGDVVLSEVLIDKGLMPEDVLPHPQVYVVAASEGGAQHMLQVVAQLRSAGLHTRFTYKTTRNVGKLLKEAGQHQARQVVILDDDAAGGMAQIKDLTTGQQQSVTLAQLPQALQAATIPVD